MYVNNMCTNAIYDFICQKKYLKLQLKLKKKKTIYFVKKMYVYTYKICKNVNALLPM